MLVSLRFRFLLSASVKILLSLEQGFPMAQLVKNPPAMRETWVRSLGWEDPLEKGKATHSSILAWRIPWNSPWNSPWSHKESDPTEPLSLHLTSLGHLILYFVVLAWTVACLRARAGRVIQLLSKHKLSPSFRQQT